MKKKKQKYILWFKEIGIKDVPRVGGKNASLGEMYRHLTQKGVNIPNGFAVSASAYFDFLTAAGIRKPIEKILVAFRPHNIKSLQETGQKIRSLILNASLPLDLEKEVLRSYRLLCRKYGKENLDVAVRSSATAEDLPSASFAGQHETYLNVRGGEELLRAVKKSYASLFTDRAIMYREEKGFKHMEVGLSTCVQKMVRSDLSSSGVMFTLDTETGFPGVVLINSIFGVGEMIVKGLITPDEFYVFKETLRQGYAAIIRKDLGRKTKQYIYGKKGGLKEKTVPRNRQLKFSLNDQEILTLARWGLLIEEYYSRLRKKWTPQDIEWAKDGQTGELFIVQSRPETVHSVSGSVFREYRLKSASKPWLSGIAIGDKIGAGPAHVIKDAKRLSRFKKGEVLVTKMTDPDWTSVFPLASAIVTDEGGKTCHAAIISRELGVPCIVGTKNASQLIKNGQEITVDCTAGLNGKVFRGRIPFQVKEYDLRKLPRVKTKIMVNIGAPEIAFASSFLPTAGVGLAREEFIIAEKIRIHPLALYHYSRLQSPALVKKIDRMTAEHRDKKEYFIKELAEGIAQIAAAFYPREVIVRFSDFKTNEYRNLIGGELFEAADEANPMLGFRGACRYVDRKFQPAFLMECAAIKRAWEVFGLRNISLMVPFCRTVEEGVKAKALIKKSGLLNGKRPPKIYVMCEIPANVVLADEFLDVFDGMSIGSNDLTQLALGLDRDNAAIQGVGDERNEAVKKMMTEVIQVCRRRKKYVGICGQAPSDFPEMARFLARQGIESMSLNPDTVVKTILDLGKNAHR